MYIRVPAQLHGACGDEVEQVSATDWPRTKSWDISLDCHIGKYRGVIRSKIVFFRISNISAPCPHAQLRSRTVIQKLWTFFGPWGSGLLSVTTMLNFSGKANTASERTSRQGMKCLAQGHIYIAVERRETLYLSENLHQAGLKPANTRY